LNTRNRINCSLSSEKRRSCSSFTESSTRYSTP